MTAKILKLMLATMLVFSSLIIVSAETKKIAINMEYKGSSKWDSDNNGIENVTGVIDFTVERSMLDKNISAESLCTRWMVYNLDAGNSATICNGNEDCCNLFGLQPNMGQWNDVFYLYYWLYGSGNRNKVSAQVIHSYYNPIVGTDADCLSDWAELPAYFTQNSLTRYSSFSVMQPSNQTTLIIYSPNNSSQIKSGEAVYLTFSASQVVNAGYYLDNQINIYLGSNTTFNNLLNGTLPYGALANGAHNISIFINDSSPELVVLNYSFIINDTAPPIILLNTTNNSIIYSPSHLQSFALLSDEYITLNYSLNNANTQGLGISKNLTFNLTLKDGINNLTLNAADLQGNKLSADYVFDFRFPSCSDSIKNGDEAGIDCGGSCLQCIDFNITTDKPAYAGSDDVRVTVIARANSTVNMTVYQGNAQTYQYKFTPVFSGAPIAEQRTISNTSSYGNYTINATMFYLNITENKIIYFFVNSSNQNLLTLNINANSTKINEGQTISFKADISGNTSMPTFKWDFNNDGSIDSSIEAPVWTYSLNGTFTVNLTINDSRWNKTALTSITVKKLHNVTFLIKDNKTGNPIELAEIDIGNEIKNTSSDGKAIFSIPYEEYGVKVKKADYRTYRETLNIANDSIELRMIEIDETPPSIQLISPLDREAITSSSIALVFKAFDRSEMSCKLFIKTGSEWQIKSAADGIINNSDSSFQLTDLDSLHYDWKVFCGDAHGNSNYSEIYSFTINQSRPINEPSIGLSARSQGADEIIAQITSTITSLDNLNSAEKEAADTLLLKETLERSKTEIQRALRDINDLKWRKLNNTELEQETARLLGKIESIKENTPISIKVLDSSEFVNYPNREIIENLSVSFLNFNKLKLNNKQKEAYIEKNEKIQSLITVTTKAKLIEVEYISGKRSKITLVKKTVKGSHNPNYAFYEFIPKNLASDINNTELLFQCAIIDRDPILEIDLSKTADFAYYIKKELNLKDTENINSVLVIRAPELKTKSILTGFSILKDLKPGYINSSDTRLIIEIIVIILLLSVYLAHSFGGIHKAASFFKLKPNKQIGIAEKLSKARECLNEGLYEKAKSSYQEINILFKQLPNELKSRIYPDILAFSQKLDVFYINKMIDGAFKSLENNEREKAVSSYSEICGIYKKISSEYKSEVLKRCTELNKRLCM